MAEYCHADCGCAGVREAPCGFMPDCINCRKTPAIGLGELDEVMKAKLKRDKANKRRRERDQIMRDLGLTKVRGAVSGRVYWE